MNRLNLSDSERKSIYGAADAYASGYETGTQSHSVLSHAFTTGAVMFFRGLPAQASNAHMLTPEEFAKWIEDNLPDRYSNGFNGGFKQPQSELQILRAKVKQLTEVNEAMQGAGIVADSELRQAAAVIDSLKDEIENLEQVCSFLERERTNMGVKVEVDFAEYQASIAEAMGRAYAAEANADAWKVGMNKSDNALERVLHQADFTAKAVYTLTESVVKMSSKATIADETIASQQARINELEKGEALQAQAIATVQLRNKELYKRNQDLTFDLKRELRTSSRTALQLIDLQTKLNNYKSVNPCAFVHAIYDKPETWPNVEEPTRMCAVFYKGNMYEHKAKTVRTIIGNGSQSVYWTYFPGFMTEDDAPDNTGKTFEPAPVVMVEDKVLRDYGSPSLTPEQKAEIDAQKEIAFIHPEAVKALDVVEREELEGKLREEFGTGHLPVIKEELPYTNCGSCGSRGIGSDCCVKRRKKKLQKPGDWNASE